MSKSFDLKFSTNPHWTQSDSICVCDECKHRVEGRFILRGVLKYLDYELKPDPWEKK